MGTAKKTSEAFGRLPASFVITERWARLSARSQAILVVLLVHAGNRTECFPGRQRLEELSGVKGDAHVRDGLRQLEEAGIIERLHDKSSRNTLISKGFRFLLDLTENPFGRIPRSLVELHTWANMNRDERALLVALICLAAGNDFVDIAKGRLRWVSGLGRKSIFERALENLMARTMVAVQPIETEDLRSPRFRFWVML